MPVIPVLGFLFLAGALAAGASLLTLRLRRRLAEADAAAEAQRRNAAARARMLGLLAQDLQGPGLALLGHAGALPPAQATAVAAEARHLLRLSDELTEWLAAEAGPRSLRPEPLALLPLLEEAVAATAARLGPGRRHWRLAPEFAALSLEADGRALRGAVKQVLARAARMTRDGDWIGLRPVLTPESLAIVVEDEGAGLPAGDLGAAAAVAAPTEADRTRGLGFGLAVARSLMEAHGGGLRMETVRDVGARAWMTLPRERLLAAS
jgi:signal transduction histidine kinase